MPLEVIVNNTCACPIQPTFSSNKKSEGIVATSNLIKCILLRRGNPCINSRAGRIGGVVEKSVAIPKTREELVVCGEEKRETASISTCVDSAYMVRNVS
jgi:hypothetical protein